VNVPAKGFFLVLIHSLLSGCAGIYTEYLMKLRVNDSFYFQNVQMYLWGTILNATVMIVFYNRDLRDIGLFELAIGRDYLTLLVVLNHALCGLSIAALIRFTDNIARVYSHAIGMAMTMTISSIFFWDLPSIQLVFGICIVSISIYLFYTDLEPHWTSTESPRGRAAEDYDKNSTHVHY
jgi:UDP-sugar transporter A1/2/3